MWVRVGACGCVWVRVGGRQQRTCRQSMASASRAALYGAHSSDRSARMPMYTGMTQLSLKCLSTTWPRGAHTSTFQEYERAPLGHRSTRISTVHPNQPRSAPISPDQPRSAPISPDQLRSAPISPDQPRSAPISPDQRTMGRDRRFVARYTKRRRGTREGTRVYGLHTPLGSGSA